MSVVDNTPKLRFLEVLFKRAVTVVGQGRLGSGSEILASSLEDTTRTSAME